ncbi:MAG: Hsp20/alpha crystallin family protein [Candidatus Pacebacteria bacterium]|nr:Hsp20/alpha crystallin family protein [Candidatus Paceibacterota bacterium]
MATLDPKDEAFFEQLSGAKDGADETYEVELARASAADMLTAAPARPKAAKAKEESVHVSVTDEESEEAWSDNEPEGKLTVDVYQTPTEIVVESAIAGVRPEDIDVNATADSVTIRGSRKRAKTVNDEDYLYQECYWGRFARSIILPQEVDPDGADVTFKNGILTVRLPKANKKKTKKLKIIVD